MPQGFHVQLATDFCYGKMAQLSTGFPYLSPLLLSLSCRLSILRMGGGSYICPLVISSSDAIQDLDVDVSSGWPEPHGSMDKTSLALELSYEQSCRTMHWFLLEKLVVSRDMHGPECTLCLSTLPVPWLSHPQYCLWAEEGKSPQRPSAWRYLTEKTLKNYLWGSGEVSQLIKYVKAGMLAQSCNPIVPSVRIAEAREFLEVQMSFEICNNKQLREPVPNVMETYTQGVL